MHNQASDHVRLRLAGYVATGERHKGNDVRRSLDAQTRNVRSSASSGPPLGPARSSLTYNVIMSMLPRGREGLSDGALLPQHNHRPRAPDRRSRRTSATTSRPASCAACTVTPVDRGHGVLEQSRGVRRQVVFDRHSRSIHEVDAVSSPYVKRWTYGLMGRAPRVRAAYAKSAALSRLADRRMARLAAVGRLVSNVARSAAVASGSPATRLTSPHRAANLASTTRPDAAR